MTDKVYFSKIGDADKWVEDNDSGAMSIILIPKRWWSIADWRIVIDFKKSFKSGFVTRSESDDRKDK